MPRHNTKTRFDVKSIADRYFQEQCDRLGSLLPLEVMPVFIPVPVTPKRNRRKRCAP